MHLLQGANGNIVKEERVAYCVAYRELENSYRLLVKSIIEPYSSLSISGVLKLTTKSTGCKTNVSFQTGVM